MIVLEHAGAERGADINVGQAIPRPHRRAGRQGGRRAKPVGQRHCREEEVEGSDSVITVYCGGCILFSHDWHRHGVGLHRGRQAECLGIWSQAVPVVRVGCLFRWNGGTARWLGTVHEALGDDGCIRSVSSPA